MTQSPANQAVPDIGMDQVKRVGNLPEEQQRAARECRDCVTGCDVNAQRKGGMNGAGHGNAEGNRNNLLSLPSLRSLVNGDAEQEQGPVAKVQDVLDSVSTGEAIYRPVLIQHPGNNQNPEDRHEKPAQAATADRRQHEVKEQLNSQSPVHNVNSRDAELGRHHASVQHGLHHGGFAAWQVRQMDNGERYQDGDPEHREQARESGYGKIRHALGFIQAHQDHKAGNDKEQRNRLLSQIDRKPRLLKAIDRVIGIAEMRDGYGERCDSAKSIQPGNPLLRHMSQFTANLQEGKG